VTSGLALDGYTMVTSLPSPLLPSDQPAITKVAPMNEHVCHMKFMAMEAMSPIHPL